MTESLLTFGETELKERMVSVSNLLLMREQQSQCNSVEHEKDSPVGLRMTVDMQTPPQDNNIKGDFKNQETQNDENDEEKRGQNRRVNDEGDDEDGEAGSCASDGDDEGESPLRIVLGANTPMTPNHNDDESEGEDDPNEENENGNEKSRYDYREQQQLLHYQQRKLQMHQDLTAYNTGSLTVTRFPMNGYPSQPPPQTAERSSSGGKFSVLPSTNSNLNESNARTSPTLGGRTGFPGDTREMISSPPLNHSTSPFYFNNNNNNNNTPNNNNNNNIGIGMIPMSKLKNNGHSQIQDQTEKLQQRYHGTTTHSQHSHGQKRHSSHSQQQQGHGHGGQSHDRKPQHGLFPCLPDVKPDSLGAHSQLNTLSRSIGNALLNLASLGSLAALQQHQQLSPNSTTPPAVNHYSGGNGNGSTNSSNNSNMTPLNLTSAGSLNTNPMTSNAANNASSYLAQYINSQQQQNTHTKSSGGGGGGLGQFMNQASQIQSGSSPPNGLAGSASLPQLILASGNIVQGIQGAQLLIPTSQGLMTQTILTIPITQPASPSNLLSPTPSGKTRPPSVGPPCPSSPPLGVTPLLNHLNPLLINQSQQQHGGGGGGGPTSSSISSSHTLNIPNTSLSEKLGAHDRMNLGATAGMNMGLNRMTNGRRENGINISAMSSGHGHGGLGGVPSSLSTICPPQKMSPCSSHSHDQDSEFDFDRGSDNDDSDQMVDGINLDEIKEFAKAFKLRRLSLGLTQTQVGQALSITEGPAYSQSAICSALAWQMAQSNSNRTSIPQSSMFEKLDITPKSAQKIKPVLERWMKEAEDRFKNGHQTLHEFVGMEPSKKRKRRTSFTPQALEILNTHFERNTHPSGAEITTLAHQLGYEREVIRIWFCNKRQALKNTVRMMSKGSSPM